MTTVSILPQGQITLPDDILKTDDISDLGGFFKNNPIKLDTEKLCEPAK